MRRRVNGVRCDYYYCCFCCCYNSQRNLHFRCYHIKKSFRLSHSVECTCLHTMTTHWILIFIAAAASFIQVLRACKPTFINQQEKDEKRNAPWRTFNFSNILHNIEDSCQCGVRPKSARISGGQDTEKNEFPWQAALVYRNTRIPFCGGTIINNLYVLTAAHCILNLPKIVISTTKEQNDTDYYIENDFQVLLNAHELTPLNDQSAVELYKRTVLKRWYLDPLDAQKDKNEGTLRFDVTTKIFHPEFLVEYQKFGFDFDVALIQLNKPVNFTKLGSPKPICLPKSSKFVPYDKTKAMTVGWGRRDFKDMTSGAPILQKLPMPIYSLEDCSSKAGVQVSKRFICAGYHTKRKDIGKSDSGGPLLTEDKGKFTQIGIVSWGAGEKEGKVASAFTRITAFLRWIHYHVDQVETPSDVVWCSRYGPQDFRLEDVRMRPSSSSGEYFEHFHFAPDLSDEDDGLETNGNSSQEVLDFMTTETSGVLQDSTPTDLPTDAL